MAPTMVVLLGCSGGGTAPAPPVTAPPSATVATTPPTTTPAAASATKALVAELAAKGYRTSAAGPGETLVCGQHACACLAELACKGDCITLAKNLEIFKQAQGVSCELADTGALCGGSYFRFEGDIYRLERRYFGADGRLSGQRNATDYPEYCGGKAMYRYEGDIPNCAQTTNVTTLCTDHHHDRPLPNPRDDLMFALGAP